MADTTLDLERDLRECPGSGQSIEIPWEQVYQHQHSALIVTCEECGQSVEAEDSNTDIEGYRLNLPRHDRADDNREGDPAFNGAFNRW